MLDLGKFINIILKINEFTIKFKSYYFQDY